MADASALTLLKQCIEAGTPPDAETLSLVDAALVSALHRSDQWRARWLELFDCLPDVGSPMYDLQDDTAICKAMAEMFGLSVSQSGAEVRVRGAADADVGILILGFGGASMHGGLQPVDDAYKKLQPGWRTVLTTTAALQSEPAQEVVQAQLKKAAVALSGCRRIVVHAT